MLVFLGILLFALLIGISIALHELGHLATAKMFGMKVTRYFIGFGPKIWSFRRGETEYGLKAIPAGGFCEITGMTALEDVAPEDRHRAFNRQKTWKRVVVLSAGSITHFIVGFIILYFMAFTMASRPARQRAGRRGDPVRAEQHRRRVRARCARTGQGRGLPGRRRDRGRGRRDHPHLG